MEFKKPTKGIFAINKVRGDRIETLNMALPLDGRKRRPLLNKIFKKMLSN